MAGRLRGRRLPDAPIGEFPLDYNEMQPGDYWFATVRRDHPEYPRRLNVKDHPEDQRWWGEEQIDPRFKSNLTGLVLGAFTPLMQYVMLSIHTVRENEDDTVTVAPGDGSSNSILVHASTDKPQWHGYIDNGEWYSV